MKYVLSAVLILAVNAPALAAFRDFQSYPAGTPYTGQHAIPVFKDKGTYAFRTRFREAAKQAPNFASEFVVAEWGCGTNCSAGGVINLRTGATYLLPTMTGEPGEYEKGKKHEYKYKVRSNLLIATGHIDDDGPYGTFYFNVGNAGLQKIGEDLDEAVTPLPATDETAPSQEATVGADERTLRAHDAIKSNPMMRMNSTTEDLAICVVDNAIRTGSVYKEGNDAANYETVTSLSHRCESLTVSYVLDCSSRLPNATPATCDAYPFIYVVLRDAVGQ